MRRRTGIIAAGNWIIDRLKLIDRFPTEGESCRVLEEMQSGGGGPCNVLCDLAAMKTSIPLYAAGRVGSDEAGAWLRNELVLRGIDPRLLKSDPHAPTSSTDVLSGNGRRTFLIRRGADADFSAEDLACPLPPAKIFYLGYLLLLEKLDAHDEIFGTGAARLLAQMHDRGMKTVVDFITTDSERYAEKVPPAMRHTDVLVINELEAGYATGISPRNADGIIQIPALAAAAEKFFAMGVREMVVFHYPEGAFLMEQTGRSFTTAACPIAPGEFIGSNGAGDAFCAGIIFALHRQLPPEEALRIANVSAWFNLHDATASGGAVSWNKIREKIEKEYASHVS